jgi:hypothetical protein
MENGKREQQKDLPPIFSFNWVMGYDEKKEYVKTLDD